MIKSIGIRSTRCFAVAAALLLTSPAWSEDEKPKKAERTEHQDRSEHQRRETPKASSPAPAHNERPAAERRQEPRSTPQNRPAGEARPDDRRVRNNGSNPSTPSNTVRERPNYTNREATRSGGQPTERRPEQTRASRPEYNRATAPPSRVYRNASGTEARLGPRGEVQSLHARGMTINHGPGGRVEVIRTDRTVIVTNQRGHGYVQRPFAYHGQPYVNRTYYVRGAAYTRYYRPYTYRGVVLHGYVPVRYYSPVFYGWVYNPWSVRVNYGWGW